MSEQHWGQICLILIVSYSVVNIINFMRTVFRNVWYTTIWDFKFSLHFLYFFSFPFVNFCLVTWTLALVSSNNKFRWVLLAHCFHILSLSALFLDLENTVFNEISHFPNNPGNHDEPQKPLSMERERGN